MTLAELTTHYAQVKRRLYGQTMRRKAWSVFVADGPEPIAGPIAYPVEYTDWQRITVEVCAKHGVTFAEMMAHRKPNAVVAARREAWWRMRQEIRINGKPPSYPTIGRWFDKNHTTVVHSVQRYVAKVAK